MKPVRRFQWPYQSPINPGDPIGNRHFINFKNLVIPSSFVKVLPGPSYGNRVEIDLIDNPRAKEIVDLQIYLYELQQELDPNYKWPPLVPELQLSNDEFEGNKLLKCNESFSLGSQDCTICGHQPVKVQKSKKMFIFVCTYFVFFCLIRFFTAISA